MFFSKLEWVECKWKCKFYRPQPDIKFDFQKTYLFTATNIPPQFSKILGYDTWSLKQPILVYFQHSNPVFLNLFSSNAPLATSHTYERPPHPFALEFENK